jgi:hypothetical protein
VTAPTCKPANTYCGANGELSQSCCSKACNRPVGTTTWVCSPS